MTSQPLREVLQWRCQRRCMAFGAPQAKSATLGVGRPSQSYNLLVQFAVTAGARRARIGQIVDSVSCARLSGRQTGGVNPQYFSPKAPRAQNHFTDGMAVAANRLGAPTRRDRA